MVFLWKETWTKSNQERKKINIRKNKKRENKTKGISERKRGKERERERAVINWGSRAIRWHQIEQKTTEQGS